MNIYLHIYGHIINFRNFRSHIIFLSYSPDHFILALYAKVSVVLYCLQMSLNSVRHSNSFSVYCRRFNLPAFSSTTQDNLQYPNTLNAKGFLFLFSTSCFCSACYSILNVLLNFTPLPPLTSTHHHHLMVEIQANMPRSNKLTFIFNLPN